MGVKAEEDENRVIADRVYIGDVSVAGMTEEEATASRGLLRVCRIRQSH